jgi:ComF family protein
MSWPVRISQWLGQALLPPRCLVCGLPGADGRDLCAACRDALPWNRPACPRCALPEPVPAMIQLPLAAVGRCGRCLHQPPPQDATVAALAYRVPLDRLLPRFKFHGDLAAGRLLAQLLADSLVDAPAGRLARDTPGPTAAMPWPDLLVPVPLHPRRLRERGYDQALELARPLGKALGIPVRADGLRRMRATAAQSTLGAVARRQNVRGAFAAAPGAWPARVALFDDVMTTGATLAACASALKQAGVGRVEAWVVARVA